MNRLNLVICMVVLVWASSAIGDILNVPSVEYPTIQSAIDSAVDGDAVVIAPGTHTDDGNWDIDFLGKAITVRSTNPNDPNVVAATIVDCNGTLTEPHRGFYFHSGEDANSVLSGFTITNGFATSGSPEVSDGGGIYCESSSPTITNCTFSGNSTSGYPAGGGGMRNSNNSSPTLMNCTFSGNQAYDDSFGGGMLNEGSSPTVTNCTFTGNSAGNPGGGMCNYENSSPTVTNCTFSDNSGVGGGMCNYNNSSPKLTNCTFSRNMSLDAGGMLNFRSNPTLTNCTFIGNSDKGMLNDQSSPTLTNCAFIGNSASFGGGMCNMSSNLTITNCTFSGNSADNGGGLYNSFGSSSSLNNCIFWANTAIDGDEIALYDSSTIDVNYSDVKGGQADIYNDGSCTVNWGSGNIDADPCFVDPTGPDYDLHLRSEAGHFRNEDSTWVYDGQTSPAIDMGDPDDSLGEETFPNGGRINQGAYGGTSEASKSYFGGPVCEKNIAGDINGDCVIDFIDFAFMARHWLEDNNP